MFITSLNCACNTTDFTVEDTLKYQRIFEVGQDPRYEHWLALYHPGAKLPSRDSDSRPPLQTSVKCNSLARQYSVIDPPQSSLSKFLGSSTPKYKLPAKEPKNSARILTSAESLRILQEKKQKKEQEAARKEERKMAREKARMMKAIEAQNKQLRKQRGKGSFCGKLTFFFLFFFWGGACF